MKNIKIRVNSPEHSRKIQEHLFSLGYEWTTGPKKIMNEIYPFLYTGSESCITYGETLLHFNDCKNQEVELIEKISYELKEVSKRNVVKIGENSYYEDELSEALKNIKPIN